MVNTLHSAKRKSFIINLLKGLVFSSLLGLLFLYNISRPRIMIIQSYDPTMDTVKDFDEGVKKILENEIEPLVQNYYMNMLNKNTARKKIDAGIEARAAIRRFKPKILIAVGDEAQEFAAKFYLEKKNIRVIFAGMKGDFKNFGYIPGKNVGAVIEVPQMQELNVLINSMFKEKKNIKMAHLGDASTIVKLTEKALVAYDWKNIQICDSVRVDDCTDFKEAAALLDKSCDVLLISSYRGLKDIVSGEEEIPSSKIMQWIVENTSVPIISTLGYAVEDGAGAAIVSSAYEQGMLAAHSALIMLDNLSYLPNLSSKIFTVFLNDEHIQKRKAYIQPIYRSFAVGTQKLFGSHKEEEKL